jgi:exopolyphosphatase/guanosine-5'-triphosphate,3'-diphosphate pyrophosphatase
LRSLSEFKADVEGHQARRTRTVATGVVRAAANRVSFTHLVRKNTGFEVEVISGEQEARLTGLGIRYGLELGERPFVAFDLGGGSTEFLFVPKSGPSSALSLPLGAVIMTQRHLVSDPPEAAEIENLKEQTRALLRQSFPDEVTGSPLVGTGGTATTLAAMVHGIEASDISPERMNGLILQVADLEKLLSRMALSSVSERASLPGLDQGRADVIVAGTLVVTEILKFFHSSEMMISLSDLLEGALLEMMGVSLDLPSPLFTKEG